MCGKRLISQNPQSILGRKSVVAIPYSYHLTLREENPLCGASRLVLHPADMSHRQHRLPLSRCWTSVNICVRVTLFHPLTVKIIYWLASWRSKMLVDQSTFKKMHKKNYHPWEDAKINPIGIEVSRVANKKP